MNMFSNEFLNKKNNFDVDVMLNRNMWISWLDIWVNFEIFWLSIEIIEQIRKNDEIADKINKILKNFRKK